LAEEAGFFTAGFFIAATIIIKHISPKISGRYIFDPTVLYEEISFRCYRASVGEERLPPHSGGGSTEIKTEVAARLPSGAYT
jgi:hypothetical protein